MPRENARFASVAVSVVEYVTCRKPLLRHLA
jgi:hypothetical protein